jgi:2-oxoisovalerate dehydrogenase E1 component beta subunit
LCDARIPRLFAPRLASPRAVRHPPRPPRYKTVAEIQFADYIFPAFDQIVNEIAKYRSRTGGRGGHCGNIVLRAPCGSVGHGSMYHSQSVEAYFAHCPGLTVVVPRGPRQAKGLLSAAINCDDPVLFFEPKALYRANFEGSEGDVPVEDYTLPLGVADVVAPGEDVTLIGWGNQVARLEEAARRAAERDGISCEVIDLQTIGEFSFIYRYILRESCSQFDLLPLTSLTMDPVPWDVETVVASVKKTGRCVVSHEAPSTNGFGAELAASITQECFLHLEAPVARVCGLDTHFPYAWEEFYLPSTSRVHAAIKEAVEY